MGNELRLGGKDASSVTSAKIFVATTFTFDKTIKKVTLNVKALDKGKDAKMVIQQSKDGVNWESSSDIIDAHVGEMVFDDLSIIQDTYIRLLVIRASNSKNSGTDLTEITFFG